MKLAMIGLGRMGGSMTERLLNEGHEVVPYAPDTATVAAGKRGAIGAHSVEVEGYVEDSGMGRWTMHEPVEMAVPVPALGDALFARFASRPPDAFSANVVAALRKQPGGHAVNPAQEK